MRRPVVTLHLPLDMGAVGRILQAVAAEYPDAVVGEGDEQGRMVIEADTDRPPEPPAHREQLGLELEGDR